MTAYLGAAPLEVGRATPRRDADLETAKLLLDRLGVTAEDILADDRMAKTAVPTFAEYIPSITAATSPKSAATWSVYWRVLNEKWPDRAIDEPTTSELKALANEVQARAARRPGARGGLAAKATFTDAVRALYRSAVDDQLIRAPRNPALGLRKPRQRKNLRRALTARQLIEINEVAATTGTDPALDTLLLRLHTETACRRGGALAIRPCDVNTELCLLKLREKGGTTRDQPISRTLALGLLEHAEERSSHLTEYDQLLRHRNGNPICHTRYETFWKRLSNHLPWIREMGITAHWIRYTTLTWVERNYGYAVAATYAGHAAGYQTGSTLTYVAAPLEELAAALSALTAEPHPLAA
ncbi:tyrosine-type recombinase/integrase [Amycolatopsis sp. RTGN1]|uniref:tyrosine-type recombinase/integrase n=1 Tax=Amycolatopsis ponsaeliensis TaxID=2992142 RepID=UPI00254BCA24|nr:site-specific integrase [Amycolatopsis sp. RTGN1]